MSSDHEATVVQTEVRRFTKLIRHGDAEHQQWLTQACEAFLEQKPIPPPRGGSVREHVAALIRRQRFNLEQSGPGKHSRREIVERIMCELEDILEMSVR